MDFFDDLLSKMSPYDAIECKGCKGAVLRIDGPWCPKCQPYCMHCETVKVAEKGDTCDKCPMVIF